MGTIAQKLEYLNDTRLLLKDNINKINNVLDDNSTFRSYPQELFNGYLDILNNGTDTLWSNLEKVSQTGTEAVLEGVETAPMKVELQGNTQQNGEPTPDTPIPVQVVTGENVVSVSGKNCLVPFVFNRTNNGIEFNYNADGSITINGTSTGTAYAIATSSVPLFTKLKAGIYTLSTTGNIAIRLDDSNGVNIVNTTTSTTFTLTEDKEVYIQIRIGSGTTIINQTIYPMIEQNSQATPYVPYSKTDYPINLVSKNLFNVSAITENLFLEPNGNVGSSGVTNISNYISVKANQTYAISFDYKTLLNTNQRAVCYYDLDKNWLSGQYIDLPDKVISITPTENGYIRFSYDKNCYDIQLEKGTASSYEPYFTPIELCKINTYKDYFHKDSGKWYVHKEINKCLLKPTNASLEENGIRARYNVDTPIKGYPTAYCNYFGIATTYDRAVNTNGNYPNLLNVNATGTLLCNIAGYTTTTQYINFFNDNDVYFYYPLATPVEEEITNTTLIEQLEAIAKAKSVKDKTYITQTNDELPFVLDVEAIKKYEVA